ncbi:MAG: class I SAM-dependent methyltransferase [Rhodobacteraceae bacterium]|nr:class I SAM-dependent methyltransferase [Paracoccaceae bacterium]
MKLPFLKKKKFSSAEYWDQRYRSGRTSGAGSYGRLAQYKADFINDLVKKKQIKSVVEFGSGDGNQANLFNFSNYLGIDVSDHMVQAAKVRFSDRSGWLFQTLEDFCERPSQCELSMSLDVIYHLVEDDVFDAYMKRLTGAATRFVLVYSSDHDAATKDIHVRHRNFTKWLAAFAPEFKYVGRWDNPYPQVAGSDPRETSFAFFQLFKRVCVDGGAGQ